MKLHSQMTAQEWKDLLNILKANDAYLIAYPETDDNGLFVDFKFVTIEYRGTFYYLQGNDFKPFSVCRYMKISPYERRQCAFPREVRTVEELFKYMNESHVQHALQGCPIQRIFSGELYGMYEGHTKLWHLENRIAGYRERAVFTTLVRITTLKRTKDHYVLRFHSADGSYFDYETKSQRITG